MFWFRHPRLPAMGTQILCVSLLLAAGSLLIAKWTLEDPNCLPQRIFEGDPLWPAQLYEDVVVDGYPFSSFMLPGANSFFPDVGLYFLIRTVTGSVQSSMVPLLLAMMLLLTLGSACAVTACAPDHHKRLAFGLAIGGISLALAHCSLRWCTENWVLRQALLPVHHGGAVSCALFGLAWVIAILDSRSHAQRIGWAVALTSLCAAIVASDRLFLVWFTGPVGLTLWLAHFRGIDLSPGDPVEQRRRLLFATGSVAVGSIVGVVVAKRIHAGSGDTLSRFFNSAVLDQLPARTGEFLKALALQWINGDLLEISLALWLVFAVVVTIRACWNPRSVSGTDRVPVDPAQTPHFMESPKFVFYCGLTCVMFAANVVIFLLSSASIGVLGIHPWSTFARYFMGPHFFAYFGWILLLTHRILPARWSDLRFVGRFQAAHFQAALVPGVTALLLAAILVQGRQSKRATFEDYPLAIEKLDSECKRLGLEYGLGDYAMARSSSLLSKENVQVRPYAVDRAFPLGFKAFHATTSAAWFWQPERSQTSPVKYEFIVVFEHPDENYGLTADDITKRFGEPVEKIHLHGQYKMLVYNRPEDTLHDVFTHEAGYLNCLFNYGGVDRVTYPGGSLLSLRKDLPFQKERTAVEGVDQVAPMAFGPLLPPPGDGHYKVVFRTSSKGVETSNGHVYAILHEQGKGATILGVKPIPPGENQEVELEFDLVSVNRLGQLDFQTVFQGKGELTLHEMEVSRDASKVNPSPSLLSRLPWAKRR